MAKFYIATRIERAKDHHVVRDVLLDEGHSLTYDWTTHGSVKRTSIEILKDVAHFMLDAILISDFVVVLLPGGKGTHTEFGAALAAGKKLSSIVKMKRFFLPQKKPTLSITTSSSQKLSVLLMKLKNISSQCYLN